MELTIKKMDFSLNKNWLLRFAALIFTAVGVTVLHDIGEPRPLHISIPRGIVNSLLLNSPLWTCSFKTVRFKFRYLAAFFVFISGLGVAMASPFGWSYGIAALIFHFWFVYDLLKGKEKA